jgi:rod shape determining protein RodA
MKAAFRQVFHGFDYMTLIYTLFLIFMGLLTVFSSSYKSGLDEVKPYFSRQLVWALLGLVAMTIAVIIDYRFITRYAYYFYFATVVFLVVILVIGKEVKGSQRWIHLLGFQLQPSEFVKVATLFALTHYLDKIRERIWGIWGLIGAITIAAVPAGLILLQPDLGTGLVLVALVGGMLFAAGIRPRHLFALSVGGIVAIPVFWGFLKDYQKARLLSFVNPNLDPLGASYQVIQSKIAIGAGGLIGKGLLGGTQSQLNFLPEQHTDFIFSVFAEQWGFLGSCLLVFLYVGLLLQAIKIAQSARDFQGSILAVGIISIISFQVLVNLLMTVGLMPVTGIPLPFMSYGGSNLLTMMTCIGFLLSIKTRSYIFL